MESYVKEKPIDSVPVSHFIRQSDVKKRARDRPANEARPVCVRLAPTQCGQGSCYVELGHTKVICYVYGPRDSGKESLASDSGAALNASVRLAAFCGSPALRPSDGGGASRSAVDSVTAATSPENRLAQLLVDALSPSVRLDMYRRSCIELVCTVIEDHGNVLSALVVCASGALTHANIELYDMVPCVTVHVHGGELFVDCGKLEEHESPDQVTLAYMPSLNQVSLLHVTGGVSMDCSRRAAQLAQHVCATHIWPAIAAAAHRHVKATAQQPAQ